MQGSNTYDGLFLEAGVHGNLVEETSGLSNRELGYTAKKERESATAGSSIDYRGDLRIAGVIHKANQRSQVRPRNRSINTCRLRVGKGIAGAGVTASWTTISGLGFGMVSETRSPPLHPPSKVQ